MTEVASAEPKQGPEPWRVVFVAGVALYVLLTILAAVSPLFLWGVTYAAPPEVLWKGMADGVGPAAMWLDRAWGWWLALTFCLAQVALGRVILRRSPLLRELPLEGAAAWVVQLGLGHTCTSVVLLALAMLGVLGAGVPIVAALLLALLLAEAYRARQEPRSYSLEGLPAPVAWIAFTLVLVWLVPYVLQTLTPNTDWDSAVYHLPAAKRLLAGQFWDVAPDLQGFGLPAVDKLSFAFFLRLGAESAIAPFSFLISGAIGLGTYALAKHLWSPRAGWWAAAIVLDVRAVWELGLDARNDNVLAFYVLLAVFAALAWSERPKQLGWILVGGATLGMILGLKLTAAVLVPVIGLPVLVFVAARRSKAVLLTVAVALLILLLPSAPWYARNAIALGDPAYPWIGGRLHRDAAGELARFDEGARSDPTPAQLAALDGTPWVWLQEEAPPPRAKTFFNLLDVFANPTHHANKPGDTMGLFMFVGLLLPLVNRERRALLLFGIGVVAWLGLSSLTSLVRFALPVFPLLAVAGGEVLARKCSRVPSMVAGALIALGVVGGQGLFQWEKIALKESFATLSGERSRVETLLFWGYNGETTIGTLLAATNARVVAGHYSRETKMLFVAEGRSHLFLTDVHPDHELDVYTWRVELLRAKGDLAQVADSLRAQGYRYVVVNVTRLRRMVSRGKIDAAAVRGPLVQLQRFLDEHTERVFWDGDVWMARLRPPRARSPEDRSPEDR